MVNLAFCRLDVFLSDQHWHSEAQHSSISIYIPSAGRSFMLEFLLWSSKKHLVWCLPNSKVFWSSAVRTSFSRRDCRFRWSWGKISSFSRIMDHDPICWMLWHHDGFFQTTAGFRSDQGRWIIELFGVIWSLSADSVYFLPLHYFDLKSDWLPLIIFLFGSPPEDLLFWYLLFVPIRYHGIFNFSRRNVPQMQTSAFVRNTDFPHRIPFSRWLGCADMVWWLCWVGFPALFYFPLPQAADPARRTHWSFVQKQLPKTV